MKPDLSSFVYLESHSILRELRAQIEKRVPTPNKVFFLGVFQRWTKNTGLHL